MKHWTAYLPTKQNAAISTEIFEAKKEKIKSLVEEIATAAAEAAEENDKIIEAALKSWTFGEILNAFTVSMKADNITKQINAATKYMERKEKEISIQNDHIKNVGEDKVAKSYLNSYNENLKLWDEMKAERDKLQNKLNELTAGI